MLIILTKTLDKKKGADDVKHRASNSELHNPKMTSRGTTLFSCGIMECDSWSELNRKCPFRKETAGASLESLWDVLPEPCQESPSRAREFATASAVTSLIRDLSLSDTKSSPATAPPSKRQCRSLSLSDEMSPCRAAWRPVGSRVWTPVEKRRCHSGGSVQRGSSGFTGSTMQRSSSFSLPTRSNTFPGTAFSLGYDQTCFGQRLVCQSWPGFQALPSSTGSGPVRDSTELHRSLSLSHEQISSLEYQAPSAHSSPDSTPELGRRAGPEGLSRSRSQPCVLNDKKIGMKRRRPEEAQEQRPSLDLVKMTQKLRNVHSLSCPGIPSEDCSQTKPVPPTCSGTKKYEADLGPAGGPEVGPQQNPEEDGANKEDLSNEELHFSPDEDGDSKKTAENVDECVNWEVESRTAGDSSQLGGELDIDQIERN
ncbi:protein FAM53B-like [Polyodon spathula]|uniref:protein FAM53B-like n=1 Tax=Polyodon spathula TaxID=7913 RepID=UPI001B7EC7AC|nr:protein FAM53B-like [Polyodon spathula]XP_041116400.1 protein FAM53B-like [Polyodon spathula]